MWEAKSNISTITSLFSRQSSLLTESTSTEMWIEISELLVFSTWPDIFPKEVSLWQPDE